MAAAAAPTTRSLSRQDAGAEPLPFTAVPVTGATTTLALHNSIIADYKHGVRLSSDAQITGNYNAFWANEYDLVDERGKRALPFARRIADDPEFVAPAADDFHLHPASPLLDAGDPSLSYAGQRDMDGDTVPYGPHTDVGADEVAPRLFVLLPQASR